MALEEAVNELIITAAQGRGRRASSGRLDLPLATHAGLRARWDNGDPAHSNPSQVLGQAVHTRGRAEDIWML